MHIAEAVDRRIGRTPKLTAEPREVARYLGYGRDDLTERLAGEIRDCEAALREVLMPRHVLRGATLRIREERFLSMGTEASEEALRDKAPEEAPAIDSQSRADTPESAAPSADSQSRADTPESAMPVADSRSQDEALEDAAPAIATSPYSFSLELESRDLAKNLKDCSRVLLFAVTLGLEVDRYLKRAQIRSMGDALLGQATAAALAENYCEQIQAAAKEAAAEEGLLARPRFSPGFGDLDLSVQPLVLEALDARRETGISLTQGSLMMPSKSVTAFIGLRPIPAES